MVIVLTLLISFVLFAVEYVVAAYALVVYIDTEDLSGRYASVGGWRRRWLLRIVDDSRQPLQTLAVWRSLVLLVVTVLTLTSVHDVVGTTERGGWVVYVLALLGVWLVHLLAVELLPRRTSRKLLEDQLPHFLWLIAVVSFLTFPFVQLYRAGLARREPREEDRDEDREDLIERALATVMEQAGADTELLEAQERQMIGSIVQLSQTVAREIMVPRIDIHGLPRMTSTYAIREVLTGTGHSRFPVYDNDIDTIIGVLYVKDFLKLESLPTGDLDLAAHVRPAFFTPESKPISDLLRDFRTEQVHLAIVVDEYGGVAGLVTLEDILEEIVGEIQDEHDIEEADFKPLPDGGFSVDAGLLVEELQEYIHTDFETGDYDTVGGLIYHLVGSVPREGMKVRWRSLRFTVISVEGQRIKRVEVHRRNRDRDSSSDSSAGG